MKNTTLRLALGAGLIALSPLAASQTSTITPSETQMMSNIARLIQLSQASGVTPTDVAAVTTVTRSWSLPQAGEPTAVQEMLSPLVTSAITGLTERQASLRPQEAQTFHEIVVDARLQRTLQTMIRAADAGSAPTDMLPRLQRLVDERAQAAASLDNSATSIRERLTRGVQELTAAAAQPRVLATGLRNFDEVLADAQLTRALDTTERQTLDGRALDVDYDRVRYAVSRRITTARLPQTKESQARTLERQILSALGSLEAKSTPNKRPTATTGAEFDAVVQLVGRLRGLFAPDTITEVIEASAQTR